MSEISGLSPPTKSSLTQWWKQFKQRQHREDEGLDQQQSSQLGAASAGGGSLIVPGSSNGSSVSSRYTRPNMPHMSHSSGALGTVRSTGSHGLNHSSHDYQSSSIIPTSIPNSSSGPFDVANLPPDLRESPIFGVPLSTSIKYANVGITLTDSSGEQFVYGYIPIVVAKCGIYLKKNALQVEGIFRLSGSARRIKELQAIFNSPPRFGKGLDWTGFNVHDAANVLRRYLNNLPEPIIPLQFYEKFRDPLRMFPRIVEFLQQNEVSPVEKQPLQLQPTRQTSQQSNDSSEINAEETNTPGPFDNNNNSSSTSDNRDHSTNSDAKDSTTDTTLNNDIKLAVQRYQQLIHALPNDNRQLLMYILDVLSLFAENSKANRMPAPNLAAIFQPSILSHPTHDMSPNEYHLSRVAFEFLIHHSSEFFYEMRSQALFQHEQQKKGQSATGDATPPEDKKAGFVSYHNPTDLPPNRHHQRRHSKSLSSVNVPSSIQHLTSQPEIVVPKQREQPQPVDQNSSTGILSNLRRNSSWSRRSLQRRKSSSSSVSSKHRSTSNSNPSDLAGRQVGQSLSNNSQTLLRQVSPSSTGSSTAQQPNPPIPSLKRTSASGTEGRVVDEDNLPPVSNPSSSRPTSPSNANTPISESPIGSPMTEFGEHRRGLAGLFSRRSKSPTSSKSHNSRNPSNPGPIIVPGSGSMLSIDQALNSPPIPTSTNLSPSFGPTDINLVHSSPKLRALGAFIDHGNDSTSSLSGPDKTRSDSSAGWNESDEEDSNISGVRRSRGDGLNEESSKRNVSKWRRSLMLFNMGSSGSGGAENTSKDSTTGEISSADLHALASSDHLSPSTSGEILPSSPSKGNLFRKRRPVSSSKENLNDPQP